MPILITPDDEIIAGHARALAAQMLDLEEVPVIVARGWTEAQKRAYSLADNKLGLNAGWDDALLRLELDELRELGFDVELTGFAPGELKTMWEGGQAPAGNGSLADRFGVPPFSVINAREGWWQDRKAAWVALGIQSELGRGDLAGKSAVPGGNLMPAVNRETGKIVRSDSKAAPISEDNPTSLQSGTSIFDPVLCELAYRWFAPPGGLVLDPFAGGSVRGIVAAKLGRRYLGIDLSARQVEANRAQAAVILAKAPPPNMVKVSAKMARLRFNGCDPEYIRTTCHASCCESSVAPSGTMITIHPSERATIEKRGGVVRDGMLEPVNKKCPFKTEAHLCGLHFTADKPFGCIASPFTINSNGTLIVRNRYRLLKCYDDGNKLPAYIAFRKSLDLIFGAAEAARLCEHLAAGGGDLMVPISAQNLRMLEENDAIKKGAEIAEPELIEAAPQWIAGDARQLDQLAGAELADFVFSCPPYANLERYSDDALDLSTLEYPEFRAELAGIIKLAVAALKPDRFACFVVGDLRDKGGNYLAFPSHVIEAFERAGARLYNEAILVTAVGSLPIRVAHQFTVARKLGKTHQNVLVFIKGDARLATEAVGPVEFGAINEEAIEPAPAEALGGEVA